MRLHELTPPAGSRKRRQRIGRGTGSGRGQKGQNARSEGFRVGFEGGQMTLAQRIPKLPGFKNPFKKVYEVVNISKLHRFDDGTTVDAEVLVGAGLARPGFEIKVLGTGDMRRKLTVEAHAFSTSAREAIEAKGGSVKVLGKPRQRGPKRSGKKQSPKPAVTEESTPPAEA